MAVRRIERPPEWGDAEFVHVPAGLVLVRAHSHAFGSTELDRRTSTDPGARFSPVRVGSRVVAVAYFGETARAAASETIFHTVGSERPRFVSLSKYASWQWSQVQVTRELTLLRLDQRGLTALGLNRRDVIDGDETSYPSSRAFAAAALEALPGCDGIRWPSRQSPRDLAYVLFSRIRGGGRSRGVTRGDLEARGPSLPFDSELGWERLLEVASALDVTIVR